MREIDLEAETHPHGVADNPRQLDRAERIALVAAVSADRKRTPRPSLQQADRGIRGGRRVALAAQRGLNHAQARKRETPVDELLLGRLARNEEHAAAVA